MTRAEHAGNRPAETVRKCVTIGLWLVAAGAAATLGVDLEEYRA